MRIRDYSTIVKNRLLYNKKETLFNALVYAFGAGLVMTLNSIVLSMVGLAFSEMSQMSIFFQFYVGIKNNMLYKLCVIVFIVTIILSSIFVFMVSIKKVLSRKKEYLNKLLLGASHGTLMIETIIENVITLAIGLVIGFVGAYLIVLVTGLVINQQIIFSFYSFLVFAFVALIVNIVASILPLFWLNIDQQK